MTSADPYFFEWEQIVDNELRKPLCAIRETCGDEKEMMRVLRRGWTLDEVKRLLDLQPLPNLPGTVTLQLTTEQLKHNSPTQLGLLVRCVIVECLEHLGATLHPKSKCPRNDGKRTIARFLNEDDSFVRRAMARPAYGR